MTHKTTFTYYTQTNGLTERFHRTLNGIISAYLRPDHKTWEIFHRFTSLHILPWHKDLPATAPSLFCGMIYTISLEHGIFFCSGSTQYFSARRVRNLTRAIRRNFSRQHESHSRCMTLMRRDIYFRRRGVTMDSDLSFTALRELLPRHVGPYTVPRQTSPDNFRSSTKIVHVSPVEPFITGSAYL